MRSQHPHVALPRGGGSPQAAPHRERYRDYGPLDEQAVERIFEPCDELRETLREQLRQIEQKTAKLQQSRSVLEKFIHDVNS